MGPPPKKKKRPRGPPQKTINKIWARFSVQRPSKALYILPASSTGKEAVAGKDGVAATTTPVWQRGPELLTEAYERAADECRRKVRKIIQECRRVNMRYRDPGWDLVS